MASGEWIDERAMTNEVKGKLEAVAKLSKCAE